MMSLRDYLQSDQPLARVLNNLAWLMAGKGFGAALSLFYLALATQLLGPKQFGYFTLILGTAQAIAAIVSFQSWQLIIRFGSHNLAGDSSTALQKNNTLTAFCIWIDLAAAIVGLFLVGAVTLLFANRFGWTENFTLAALSFSAVMLLSIKSSAIGVLRLYDRFKDGALAAAVTPLMRLIGACVAWAIAPTVEGFLAAWALAEIATTAAHFLLVRFKTPVRPTQSSWAEIKAVPSSHDRFYSFAMVTNAGSTLKSFAQQVPLLVVGFLIGPAAAGFFRLAYQLKDAAAKFAEMLSRALYAEFASVHARGGLADGRKLFAQTRWMAMVGAVMLCATVYFFGRSVLVLIAGEEYLMAYPLLQILALAAAIELFGVGYEPRFMATGKPQYSLIIRAVSAVFLIAIMVFALPSMGAAGAAYAVLAYSAISVGMLVLVNRWVAA